MQLDKVTAELRPRNPWEAMDLGVVLLRSNLKAVYVPWLLTVVPCALLLFWVLRDHLLLAVFFVWWLKPAYDRLVLFVLSRALFGAAPTTRETLRASPSLLGTGLLWALTLYRFDFARSFNLPVWQLEGLRGSARWQRAKVLQDDARGHAVGLTVSAVHIDVGLQFAFLALLVLLVPPEQQGSLLSVLLADGTGGGAVAGLLAYLLALSVIEPLYVACGFTLYLTRRTRLEAWDIEVAFRRLTQRLDQRSAARTDQCSADPSAKQPSRPAAGSGLSSGLVLALILGLGMGSAARAQEPVDLTDPEEARQAIESVLAQEQFGNERETKYWALKSSAQAEDDAEPVATTALGLWLSRLGEFAIWLLVLLLLIILIANYGRWRVLLSGQRKNTHVSDRPSVLFGMEISKQSLPDDIPGTAWQRWEQGDHLGAISLLYRGALATLVDRDGLKLTAAATEGDSIRAVKRRCSNSLGAYFESLTRGWLKLAYAHQPPTNTEARQLCQQWPTHFAETLSSENAAPAEAGDE